MHKLDQGALKFRYDKTFVTLPDFVCKTENLKEDLIHGFQKSNFPLTNTQIRLLNDMKPVNTSRRNIDYRCYYNNKSRKLVEHKEREIIQSYGYKFMDKCMLI